MVGAATDHIKQAADADFAWLQSGPKQEGFYRQSGWVHMPQLQILSGDPPRLEENGFFMLLFVSDYARARRHILEKAWLHLGPYLW